MKPTQEQVIAWAREAGVIKCDCCLPFWPEDDQPNWEIFFERLAALAYEAGRKDEINRIVNLLMIQHEAAKDRHNYWLAAARLVQGESA